MRHLKNFVLIITAHLFAFHAATAQFDLNLKYGASVSSVHTQDAADAFDGIKTPLTSHFVEATAGYDLNPLFNISTGVNYRTKGFGLDYTIDQKILGFNVPIGARAELNVKAISIPVKLKYNLPLNAVEAYGFVGGGYSFHMNPQINTTANFLGEIDIASIDASNQVFTVGVGYSMPF